MSVFKSIFAGTVGVLIAGTIGGAAVSGAYVRGARDCFNQRSENVAPIARVKRSPCYTALDNMAAMGAIGTLGAMALFGFGAAALVGRKPKTQSENPSPR